MENKHCLNIKVGQSLLPNAKKMDPIKKINKKSALVMCWQLKTADKKCDISAVAKPLIIFRICLKNCSTIIVENQLQNDPSIIQKPHFVQNPIIAANKIRLKMDKCM